MRVSRWLVFIAALIMPTLLWAQWPPLGGEFQVNTYTSGRQSYPDMARDDWGNFVVVWQSDFKDGSNWGIIGQRFDSAGGAVGGEFLVNTYTTGIQSLPAVAMVDQGAFVVVWNSDDQDGSNRGIFSQRFDSAGVAVGGESQVNTYTIDHQVFPRIATDGSGAYVVVWESAGQDGSSWSIIGQRFDSAGGAVGGEFQVNTYTTGSQSFPSVAMDDRGTFEMVWHSDGQDGDSYGIFGQRFDSAGGAVGGESQVNTYTTDHQAIPKIATDESGVSVVVWESTGQDGSSTGIFGQRFSCDDSDGDGLCDFKDITVTSPVNGETLDCTDPRTTRPTIAWDAGNYDRFKVLLGSTPGFAKGTRVSSGDTWLRDTTWTPSRKKWRRACRKAVSAYPCSPKPPLYIRVLGKDRELPKKDLDRKTYSQIVQVDVQR
jgi:hypothetical protein